MKKILLTLVASSLFLIGCRDENLLDKAPQGTVSEEQLNNLVAQYPEKALVVTQGFEAGNNKYLIQFSTNGAGAHDDFGYMSVLLGMEHMTNDFLPVSSHWFSTYYNYLARNVDNSRTLMVWRFYYKTIYNMNNVLKNIPAGTTDPTVLAIKGRALAIRANSYLDLLRLYGVGSQGIPYYSESVNENARVATATVMGYIEKDLNDAYTALQSYTRPNKQVVNKNVVAGFLARFYMTKGDYAKAAQFANAARQGYVPMNAAQLTDGFDDISNPEWMWGADIDGSTTTVYASFFSHVGNRNPGYAGLLRVYKSIDSRLFAQISSTDLRKEWFADTGNSFGMPRFANLKFYDDTFFLGDYVFMRAAEMYFIEAEALARAGNETQAKQVLFDIMSRRDPSYVLSTRSGSALLDEITVNKRIELWGEGQNFFDMKRWNVALTRNYTGSNHASHGFLNIPAGDGKFNFQIPQAELDANKKVSNP